MLFWRAGVNTSTAETPSLARSARFTVTDLVVELVDGRTVSVPLAWFPTLARAARRELENFEILADGEGIHWPDLDEDLSVAGLLRGNH
jgi:hypothetical protein